MFLQSPENLTCLALLLTLFFVTLKKCKISYYSTSVPNLPPGPKKLPIIGDLHRVGALPFRSYRDLAKIYGPIMHLKFGEISAIVMSSPEIAKLVLKEHDPCFADRYGSNATKILWYNYIDISFCAYGEYWRQMRKICIVELLSAKNVRTFEYIRNEEVSRLLKSIKLSHGNPINLTEKIFAMTSSITCRAAFGKVCKDSSTLIRLVQEGLDMASGFCTADLFPSSKIINFLSWSKPRLVMMRHKLDTILDDIIDEHKVNLAKIAKEDGEANKSPQRRANGEFGNEDLVDVLLRTKEEGELKFPINNENIKAVLFDMFTAGTETSSTAIDWTMTELIRNPGTMTKAQAEVREVFKENKIMEQTDIQKLKYLKLVVKESLRLHPPVPVLPRASREEETINGYTIPAKSRVLINNWAIQRDPLYWTNPESFEPERFEDNSREFIGGDFEFLPFGSGKRMCPGMTFGLANVELPLAQLLYNFDWKLPDGVNPEDLNMIENVGLTATRKDNLFLIATPYEPQA